MIGRADLDISGLQVLIQALQPARAWTPAAEIGPVESLVGVYFTQILKQVHLLAFLSSCNRIKLHRVFSFTATNR
jgi:hypothetical protein